MGLSYNIVNTPWPTLDEAALVKDELTIVVQVLGKKRAELTVSASADNKTIEAEALAHPGVIKHLEGKTVRKVIVVPGRLVNIVAN